jgi:23S rRNA pseudouridine1911/1915/1917 synthase
MWNSILRNGNTVGSSAVLILLFLFISDDFDVLEHSFCSAFSSSSLSHYGCILRGDSQHSNTLWAKPPPISNFDLASIEAFEATVDSEEDLRSDNNGVHYIGDHGDDQPLNNSQTLSIPSELKGKRIDAALAAMMEPQMSRSACGNLVADGCVHQVVMKGNEEHEILLNRKSFKVEGGMTLRITMPETKIPDEITPQNIPLKIVYEDEHMIVINKDAGMVVHPAAGNWDGTVVNALAYYLANDSPCGMGDLVGDDADDPLLKLRPGIVHRLDKGTTGILIVSKTKEALTKLSAAFAERKVKKTYVAITVGNPGKRAVIDKPIGRHPIHRQRMRVVPDPHRRNSRGVAPKDKPQSSPSQSGRRALSFVETLQFNGKLSLAQVRIETGRTHQIRVHLQDRRTPIYGDDVYGIADWNKRLLKAHGIQRPLLHAHRLEINHPMTGEHMIFVAPMATDMVSIAKGIWPDGENAIPELYSEV